MVIRYSSRHYSWWNGEPVTILEDRYTHKYRFIVNSISYSSDWCDTPSLALKDYNSKYTYPRWNEPDNPWPDWYTGNQEDDPELIAEVLKEEKRYNSLSTKEKIEEINQRIIRIEAGTDYMTKRDWELVHKLEDQIKQLREA